MEKPLPQKFFIAALMVILLCASGLTPYVEHNFYTLTPNKIGRVVHGLNLSQELTSDVVRQLVRDTYEHQILLFKNQGRISADKQVEITLWFGEKLDTHHRIHPKAEHEAVFRVS